MRILQLTLLLWLLILFIFIGQVDEQYIKLGFYCSLGIVPLIGLFIYREKLEK
tara:strand:+ start:106 stop:264 length:159 start_codon:yes stop_codon:yes gene_type:complete